MHDTLHDTARDTLHDIVAMVGAGTIGQGIAQVAALAGHPVLPMDAAPGAAEHAVSLVRERVKGLVARGRLDAAPDALESTAVEDMDELSSASVVIEAIVEDLAAKRRLFTDLEQIVPAGCVLASNTSSLSPTALVTGWGKTVVRAQPAPGFVVNRVARPYYAEAWRLLEERAAPAETIDAVLTGAGGFPLGPFALMDLIGHDVNQAVTRSVWTAFGHDPRFAVSAAQRALVEAGRLGRKSGRGVYAHDPDRHSPTAAVSPPRPVPQHITDHGAPDLLAVLARSGVPILTGTRRDGTAALPSGALLIRNTGATATELSARHGTPVITVDRTLDDDTAMRLGASHPLGPLAWGDRWGAATVHTVLTALQGAYGDPRYRPSPLLRRRALSGEPLA